MGRRKKNGRDVSGIVLLDKPAGISSNRALQQVKRTYNANKAGHTGSLDVPATGLLPVCLGEATKVSAFLLDADKTYVTRGKAGVTTTTGDAAGEILAQRTVDCALTEESLLPVLKSFIGEIEQVPPMFSALKHQGKRLYELAYQGIEVERKPRKITIYGIELLDFSHDEFEIRVDCSKGMYIRSLVQDIGDMLGYGAHVLTLRRLRSGPFTETQMLTLEELEQTAVEGVAALDELLIPMDQALTGLPEITLNEEGAHYLCQGQAVMVTDKVSAGCLRIYDQEGCFLGIGEPTDDGRIKPKRLINK